MAVVCTECFRTKAPHDDQRISARLLSSKGEHTAFRIIDETWDFLSLSVWTIWTNWQ